MARGVTLNATISARDAASKNIKRVNSALSGLGNTAKQVGADFRKVALVTAGLAAGAAAFTASAIKDAAADQAAQSKLLAALKARGLATDSVTKAIDAQISAAAKLGFTDDEVRASVEVSTRFTKNYAVAQKMQTVAMDLARSSGITLEEATLAVGKAYQGTGGKLLKNLGITAKGVKGTAALNAILGKTRGSAEAYGKTAEGAFSALSIQAAELKESFGDAFLPAVTKLFIGLQPFLDRFANYIKAATPTIQKFADELVTKLLAKLPGWIAAAEEKFPSILRQIGKFADDIKGVGKSADGLLGPGGSITLLVTGIGAAFGGLRGAIATNLLKGGTDPIKAYFISTVAAGVIEGVVRGLAGQIVARAIGAFAARMAAASAAGAAASAVSGAAGLGGTAAIAGGLSVAALAPFVIGVLGVAGVVAAIATIAGGKTGKTLAELAAESGNAPRPGQTSTTYSGPAIGPGRGSIPFAPFAGVTPGAPMAGPTSTTAYNIFIGTGKVDTVVANSIKRTTLYGRGR
jgi:hypothetical protein